MNDPTSKLRTATLRAKSDVANKLISMFLHELSKKICREWGARVDSEEYGGLVRLRFGNHCPYCLCDLAATTPVVEHLDGMNRYRVGLHIPGNVVIACRKCNSEKRRDDACKILNLADSGWACFLSHDGNRCAKPCPTCQYWETIWIDETERKQKLSANLQRIQDFRKGFSQFEEVMRPLSMSLPSALTHLYSDCQIFAETEIASLLQKF